MKSSIRVTLWAIVALLAFVAASGFAAGRKSVADSDATTDVTLTFWTPMHPDLAPHIKSFAEVGAWARAMEVTGIKLEFIHPPAGQTDESFNLMVASRDLADMINHNWMAFPGGPSLAFDDEIITPLNGLVGQYSPNYLRQLQSSPEANRQARTDDGELWGYGRLMLSPINRTYFGPTIRGDWLEELGLQPPQTMDDWYTMLTAFKEEKGANSALIFLPSHIEYANPFVGAYGIAKGFHHVEGEVKFGPIEPEYRDFLAEFAKWYQEGLIDPEFAANDVTTYDNKIVTEEAGVFFGFTSGGLGRMQKLMENSIPSVHWIPGEYPSLRASEEPPLGNVGPYYQPAAVAIAATSDHKAAAATFLDFPYSEEGHMLFNFGIEGESFEYVDGEPKLTDQILNHPDYASLTALSFYSLALRIAPAVNDPRVREQLNTLPEMTDAQMNKWSNTTGERVLPPISPLSNESARFSAIMSEVNTYVDEAFIRFVMGRDSLDVFDEYVKQIKRMGIDEAIAIQQAALDRYLSR